MFTIDQIKAAHSKVKTGADFPQYIQELKALGVVSYDNFVSDGRTYYYGANNFSVVGDAKYPSLDIRATGAKQELERALKIHQEGETDYLTFCRQAATAGVEKWTVHLVKMTCTYFDKAGKEMLVEKIPG